MTYNMKVEGCQKGMQPCQSWPPIVTNKSKIGMHVYTARQLKEVYCLHVHADSNCCFSVSTEASRGRSCVLHWLSSETTLPRVEFSSGICHTVVRLDQSNTMYTAYICTCFLRGCSCQSSHLIYVLSVWTRHCCELHWELITILLHFRNSVPEWQCKNFQKLV